MEFKNCKLIDLAFLNKNNIDRKYGFDKIKYLDTSNITRNKINEIVEYNIIDAPSRAKRIVKNDDIIYSTVRPNQCHYGVMKNISNNFVVSTGFTVITVKENVDPYYIYLFLSLPKITNQLQLLAENSASTYPSIKPSDIGNVIVSLPSIENQKKIVKILSSLDLKIELNSNIINNLLELSQQLFIKYFSNYKFVNELNLGTLCNIKYGKGLPISKIVNRGYPVYGGNGIIGYYTEKMYNEPQLLISCRGAASGKVLFSKPNSFITNNSLILECERKYYFYIKELSLLNPYYKYSTGSAQPQITIDNIKDIMIKVPDDFILSEFNNILHLLEIKYFNCLEEVEKLSDFRNSLLPKIIDGELNLENIEI